MSFDRKKWVADNREHLNKWRRDYMAKHPEKKLAKKRHDTKKKYGITDDQLDALWSQSECAICGSTTNLDIDHCHATGKIRERLCRPCNLALGFYERPEWLARAKEYLARHEVRSEQTEN